MFVNLVVLSGSNIIDLPLCVLKDTVPIALESSTATSNETALPNSRTTLLTVSVGLFSPSARR